MCSGVCFTSDKEISRIAISLVAHAPTTNKEGARNMQVLVAATLMRSYGNVGMSSFNLNS